MLQVEIGTENILANTLTINLLETVSTKFIVYNRVYLSMNRSLNFIATFQDLYIVKSFLRQLSLRKKMLDFLQTLSSDNSQRLISPGHMYFQVVIIYSRDNYFKGYVSYNLINYCYPTDFRGLADSLKHAFRECPFSSPLCFLRFRCRDF